MSSVSRAMLNSLLPSGSLWTPDEDFDQLLDGVADGIEPVREYLLSLANLRDPLNTPILPDLEREYGIMPDDTVDDVTRRARLYAVKTGRNNLGTYEFMEQQLRAAGFDMYVHANDPPVDPSMFIGASLTFGYIESQFGHPTAQFGVSRGELVVNGDTWEHGFFTGVSAGDSDAICGYTDAICQKQAAFAQTPIEYFIPTDPRYWPFIFFVGGAATRGAGGELTGIEPADVPVTRRAELVSAIVRYKPKHMWCGLIARYTQGA